MMLSIYTETEQRGSSETAVKIYAEGICVYVHPLNRFCVFDFGGFRDSFTEREIEKRAKRKGGDKNEQGKASGPGKQSTGERE